MDRKIQDFVLSLGISPLLKGFRAICVGIRLLLENPEYSNQITKLLYPRIAAEIGDTRTSTERNIRGAVDRLFDTQDYDSILSALKMPADRNTGKYTSSEFLVLCAMRLRGASE